VNRVFRDNASGRDTTRPQLTELLRFARDGDTVVVHSMNRLARNNDNLRALPVPSNWDTLARHSPAVWFRRTPLNLRSRKLPPMLRRVSYVALAAFGRAPAREPSTGQL
jgi:hypothetical protein